MQKKSITSPLSIVSVSAEVAPFSQTGGLADVARSLPVALSALGHDVIVITPMHRSVGQEVALHKGEQFVVHFGGAQVSFRWWQSQVGPNTPAYLLENSEYFGDGKRVYQGMADNERYALFCAAALQLMKHLKMRPNIIQCHDWHTGLIPQMIKEEEYKSYFSNTATVFTIHNLQFQLGRNWWEMPVKEWDKGNKPLPPIADPNFANINFAKRGIRHATVVNAVSEQYAKEIMTREFGAELHELLIKRQNDVYGIVNGIDYDEYNPATDPGLSARYSLQTLDKKVRNKTYLQRMFGLPMNEKIPVIGMVTRITEQKGFDLMIDIMDTLLKLDLQLVILGAGEKQYEDFFRKLTRKNSDKLASSFGFNRVDATKVYAGSDMFLMPSRFEPCGLGQLISLRYGSVPIVHAVGGLANTVSDYTPRSGKGIGFTFQNYSSQELLVAITRALELYKDQKKWQSVMRRGMSQVYSWEIPAQKYVLLFRAALRRIAK